MLTRIFLGLTLLIPVVAEPFDARWQQLKSQLSNDDLYKLLWALPKGGDLHNHHEFSIPMTFWMDAAAKRNFYTRANINPACGEKDPLQWITLTKESVAKLPACEQKDFKPSRTLNPTERKAWLSALILDENENRDEFFERIVLRLGDLERDAQLMADGLVIAQKQLQAENALYLETQADPRGCTGLTDDQSAQVFRRRLARSDSRNTHVAVRMQVSTIRFRPDALADVADGFAFVHRNRDLWVGVNLVGREDNPDGAPARFASTIAALRPKFPDVLLSLHAGESSTPDHNIDETLALGATRIGHGTNAYQDPAVMAKLRNSPYLIEVSLTSNQALGYMPDLHQHPFAQYLRQNIPVCLNTDDRGIMDSNLTDEYFAAVSLFNLTWPEIVKIGRDSLKYSFAEPALKSQLLAQYDRNVAAFEQKYQAPNSQQALARVKAQPTGFTSRVFKLRPQN